MYDGNKASTTKHYKDKKINCQKLEFCKLTLLDILTLSRWIQKIDLAKTSQIAKSRLRCCCISNQKLISNM